MASSSFVYSTPHPSPAVCNVGFRCCSGLYACLLRGVFFGGGARCFVVCSFMFLLLVCSTDGFYPLISAPPICVFLRFFELNIEVCELIVLVVVVVVVSSMVDCSLCVN